VKNAIKILLILGTVFIIFIAGIGVTIYFFLIEDNDDPRSIDHMNKYSYETAELTTDLNDGKFVRVQFLMITDGKKGLKEIEKRSFQIKNTVIKEISLMEEEDFKSGINEVEKTIKTELNKLMTDGEITDVYTTMKILQ